MLHILGGHLNCETIQVCYNCIAISVCKITADKIQGEKGPLGKPLLPLEQFQRSLQEQTSIWEHRGALSPTFSLLHMPQRISNMEQCLHDDQGIVFLDHHLQLETFVMLSGGNRPKDLLSRVAQLEIRLLAVEGRSWEYNHVKVSTKKQH